MHSYLQDRFDTLSPREHECLGLVAEGRSNPAIAEEMHIHQRTVDRHMGSVYAKLGLEFAAHHNIRVKAVALFLEAS